MYTQERIYLFLLGFVLRCICAGANPVSMEGATLSTNGTIYPEWVVEKAIDGRTSRKPDQDITCTAIERPTWLQLNITQTYFVERVVLQGRTDGAFEQLKKIDMYGGYDDTNMVQQQITEALDSKLTYAISPPQAMRTIRVIGQKNIKEQYMTLCEIEVYRQKDCGQGTYGPNCNQRCHCLEGPCDTINGTCGSECQAGWRGATCNETCDNGWHGQGCRTKCGQCLNNTACNKASGVCRAGCSAGYNGSLCTDECDNGRFGQGCLNECGQCVNNVACTKTSGVCPDGCAAGYKGYLCTDECENQWYGPGCQNRCGYCQHKVACNKVSGDCPGQCQPGYNGTMCTHACFNGWYGQGCLTRCGHCLNNAACNKTSGVCPDGCAAGYNGSLCTDVCDVGFFGDYCSTACGKCNGACHHIDGTCSQGCKEGFTGDLCMTQMIKSAFIGQAVGGSVGGIVVIAIVVIIVFRRRRSTPTKRHQLDDIHVAIQNGTDYTIEQTPTTSKNKPLNSQRGNISNAVYANTVSPEEDGLYYNSKSLHRERKRTEIRLIAVDKLREFVRGNYQYETIFQQEFDKIHFGLQHPTIVASAATGKNRYKEMYAYDHSRVILRRIADEPNSDYINACHVDGYMEEKKYIASQGPVNPMVGDFWRMVWEQDVCIIIMATKLVEEGNMKCLKYWGESKPIIHGTFAVTLSEEKEYSCYTIRTITVHEKDKPRISRNVTQFHYTAWPDKSVPTSSTSLVQFWRKIRCQKRTAKQPWLIHCSAGVGRTGTFIAMDYLYDQGKETGNIDIPQCVTNLRAQRVNMVQTASQYRYLYKLMLEMLVLPSQPVTTEQLSGDNMALKEQYLDLSTEESLFPDEETYKSATTNENQSKNRSMDILAADNYRPYLSSHIPNTTDYINAVIMPSFKLPTRFIITQAPLEHSFVDFCRLICEKEIALIISFDDSMSEEEKCLPGENETKSISGIRLTGVSCEPKDGPDFYTRLFDLNLKQKTHRFSQIVYTGWSQTMELPQSPRSFMDLLRHVRNVTGSEAPILVTCLNGADKSGLFVVIWTLLEHLEIDGEVSIPRVVRHLRLRRKQIIPTFDQFKFCADCIVLDDANTYANF